MSGIEQERLRQRALMQALLGDELAPLQGWVADASGRAGRALQAYRATAGASAERTLASAYPTVQALVGDDSFADLARALWHARPPERGDLAAFGDTLPDFIAASPQLADVPYLADVARLDWLVACAERAADDEADAGSLNLLADVDPEALCLVLAPGAAILRSEHPVVTVWAAHRDELPRFDEARAALRGGRRECALVWRQGWRGRVDAVDDATARWTRALLAGQALSHALDEAGAGFDFQAWLVHALTQGQLLRAERVD
jgi:hypothetical protein